MVVVFGWGAGETRDHGEVVEVHNIIRGSSTVPKGLKELVALQKSLA